ncbi:hypothetical protein V2J09_014214 [Rumex salicifolius]
MKISTRMPSFVKLILLTTLLLRSTSAILVKAQLAECTFNGTEIEKCLIQQEGQISPKPCCTALNQAIQVGFYCLCSLIATSSNGPHLSILLSGSLTSGCEISIPPIALCQGSAPTPVFFPTEPELPEHQLTPFTSSSEGLDVIQMPPFSQELYVPFSESSNCNYMASGRQPPCLANGETSSWNWDWIRAFNMLSSGGNKAKTFPNLNWVIFSVVCGGLLLV